MRNLVYIFPPTTSSTFYRFSWKVAAVFCVHTEATLQMPADVVHSFVLISLLNPPSHPPSLPQSGLVLESKVPCGREVTSFPADLPSKSDLFSVHRGDDLIIWP